MFLRIYNRIMRFCFWACLLAFLTLTEEAPLKMNAALLLAAICFSVLGGMYNTVLQSTVLHNEEE